MKPFCFDPGLDVSAAAWAFAQDFHDDPRQQVEGETIENTDVDATTVAEVPIEEIGDEDDDEEEEDDEDDEDENLQRGKFRRVAGPPQWYPEVRGCAGRRGFGDRWGCRVAPRAIGANHGVEAE